MQNNTDKVSKTNYQSKLRLKRNNSDSSSNTLSASVKNYIENNADSQDSCNSDQSFRKESVSRSPNTEDSLADFKSPQEKAIHKQILSKFKIDAEKVKKKIYKPTNKPSTKSSKRTSDVKQPSIESSFFKPQTTNQNEIKESIPCPLCLKPFKDDEACTIHMKTCATRNKVSVKQLLDAKKLQDRQAEERKAMGLLAAPVLPERKKVYRSKNFSTGDDPQLQLVMAMSESLFEAQQIVELEQAALLAGIPSECIKEMSDEDRRSTLQSFGFTTNKPRSDVPTNRARKKKLLAPTILQTRSKEDKDRVLTERIACILTGDDALTQAQRTEISHETSPTILRSKILKQIEQTSNKLWDKSRLTKKFNNFYVEELKQHFLQPHQQPQKTELLNSELICDEINNYDEENVTSNSSVVYEPMDIDIIVNRDGEQNNSHLSDFSESKSMNYEIDFMKKLVSNWEETLNDSAASDVIIFVKDKKHIYGHRLVFHVQCSNILLDIEPNDTESQPRIKEKICWLEKNQLSALAFLEFIYCGTINKNTDIFNDDVLISEIKQLAKLYRVKELFTYIRIKQKQLTSKRLKELKNVNNDVTDKDNNQNDVNIDYQSSKGASQQKCNSSNIRKSLSFEEQSAQNSNSIIKYHSDPTPIFSKSANKQFITLSVKNENDRRNTISPDIFESESEEENIYSCNTQMNNQTEICKNNTNLKILKNLIDEDENNISTQNIQPREIKENEYVQINSQQTIVNLSNASSPQSHESFNLSSEENIYEALTPKSNRLPDIHDETTQEKINCNNEQVAEAVIPKLELQERQDDVNEIDFENEQISGVVTPKRRRSLDGQNNISGKLDYETDQIAEVKTPECNTSSRLSEYITPKKAVYVCVNLDNSITEGVENDDDSIHTAVTPPRSNETHETQFDLNKKDLPTKKTDLSVFIDKIRRENDKSILDSDTDTDTSEYQVKPRNPFLSKDEEDSYAYLQNNGNKNREHRRGISLLEEAVEKEKKSAALKKATINSKNSSDKRLPINIETHNSSTNELSNLSINAELPNKFVQLDDPNIAENSCTSFSNKQSQNFKSSSNIISESSTNKNNDKAVTFSSSDEEIQNTTVNETEMSMYSRYRKTNKHHNSIDKYRKELYFNPKDSSVKENVNTSRSTSRNILLRNSTVTKRESKIEDITLVSDSDDEQNNSKSVMNKKQVTNHNDSDIILKKKDHSKLSDLSTSSIQDDSTFPLSLINNQLEQSTISKKESKKKVIDLSSNSIDESIHNDSTFPYNLAADSDNSLKKEKCSNKESCTGKNKQKEYLEMSGRINDDVDAEIGKILQLSPEFINENVNLINESKKTTSKKKLEQKTHTTNDNENQSGQLEVINLSPISITSSPEVCEYNENNLSACTSNKTKNYESKENKSLNKKKVIELESIDDACFDDIEFDDNWNTKSPSRDISVKNQDKLPFLDANVTKRQLTLKSTSSKNTSRKSNISLKPSTSENSQISTLISSPILSQHKRKSRTSLVKSPTFNKSKRRSASPEHLEKTRTLKIKSFSAASSTADLREFNERTPKQQKQASICKNDQTPLIDYNTWTSPELQKELNKFGLKPQTRPKAVLLLKHIFNQTHSVAAQKRTSSNNDSSDDEKPPPKKQNVKKSCKKNILEKKSELQTSHNSQNCKIIAEEMDYDEPEILETVNTLENHVSIKDAFVRLIETNKELYTKVLMYEPLPLESLHLMLKQKGLKCKINGLMDFLDEQCITFQVQTGKGNRVKNKKK